MSQGPQKNNNMLILQIIFCTNLYKKGFNILFAIYKKVCEVTES